MLCNVRIILLILLFVSSIKCYAQIQSNSQFHKIFQTFAQFPVIVIYYDSEFANSPQFQDSLAVIEETQERNKDYARFILSDCDDYSQPHLSPCGRMKELQQHHKMFGYEPTSVFLEHEGKKIQNSPRILGPYPELDEYSVQAIEEFLNPLVSNYFNNIVNAAEYQKFLLPRYSPKLIYASRQYSVPLVLSKLSTHFFLRFDMGFVLDTYTTVVQKLNLPDFPCLMVLKYNYLGKSYDVHYYEYFDFKDQNYGAIKKFLLKYALQEPRNDVIFHRMQMQKDQGIITVDRHGKNIEEMLDRIGGWILISNTRGEPIKLRMLRQRYGRYFTYIHFKEGPDVEHLEMWDGESQKAYPLVNGQVVFKPINQSEFMKMKIVLVKKDFLVIGVREKFAHYCGLAFKPFFRGFTKCIIISEKDYPATSKSMSRPFTQGFASYETNTRKTERIMGHHFQGTYEECYRLVQGMVRIKFKQIMKDYKDRPFKKLDELSDLLDEMCDITNKKCALLLTNSSKSSKTVIAQVLEATRYYASDYKFYEVDLTCNRNLIDQIEPLRRNRDGLIVYNPNTKKYSALRAKVTKSTFKKFLEINLIDNNKLPQYSFKETIVIRACNAPKSPQPIRANKKSSEEQSL